MVLGIEDGFSYPNPRGRHNASQDPLVLIGLHTRTGTWIELATLPQGRSAASITQDCARKTQPLPAQVAIFWEGFTAFRCVESSEGPR